MVKVLPVDVAASPERLARFEREARAVASLNQLKVSTLLEGSVRKTGTRVRISVQLVKTSDGFHLWSDTYDRTLDDVFAVQDDIAQEVVKALRTTLLGEAPDPRDSSQARAEVAAATKGRGSDEHSHRLAMQGRALTNRKISTDINLGIALLEQAVALDPTNALAGAYLAQALIGRGTTGLGPLDENLSAARVAAHQALTLEPALPEAWLALGHIQLFHDFDWNGCERSIRRALELAPDSSEAMYALGLLSAALGDAQTSLQFLKKAVDVDPLNTNRIITFGRLQTAAGQLAKSEQTLRRGLTFAPGAAGFHSSLAAVLALQGRLAEAREQGEQEDALWARLVTRAIVSAMMGESGESDRALAELISVHSHDAAFQVAEVYGVRRDADAAFQWLERSLEQRDAGLIGLKLNIWLRPLHNDPRWPAFLEKLRLTSYSGRP